MLKSSGLIWKLVPANDMLGMYESDMLQGKRLEKAQALISELLEEDRRAGVSH